MALFADIEIIYCTFWKFNSKSGRMVILSVKEKFWACKTFTNNYYSMCLLRRPFGLGCNFYAED